MDSVNARETDGVGQPKEGAPRLVPFKFDPTQHYEIVSGWWQGHGWPIVPLGNLPKNGVMVGHVTDAGIVPVCAGFLYKSDSELGWFEWAVVDPGAGRDVRGPALDLMVESIWNLAKKLGFKGLVTSTRGAAWVARLEKNGWVATDQGCTQLVRR